MSTDFKVSLRFLMLITFAVFMFKGASAHAQSFWGNDRPQQPSASVFANGESLRSGQVVAGTIVSVRGVKVEGQPSTQAAGTGLGGALGALLGAAATNGNSTGEARAAAALIGGALGALAGNRVSNRQGQDEAFELIVRKSDGSLVAVVQAEQAAYSIGMPVFLIRSSSGNDRVVPAPAMQSQTPVSTQVGWN